MFLFPSQTKRLVCNIISGVYSFPFHHLVARHNLPLLRILLGILLGLFIKRLPIILVFLRGSLLQGIVRLGLEEQLLGGLEDVQDLRGWFPGFRLQYANTHASLLVEGDIRVVDASLEVDLRRLEWILVREGEEELKFAALERTWS